MWIASSTKADTTSVAVVVALCKRKSAYHGVSGYHLAKVLPLHANAPQVLHIWPQAPLDAAVVQAGTLCEGLVQLDPRDACALQEGAHRAITALVGPDRRHGGSLHVKKVSG